MSAPAANPGALLCFGGATLDSTALEDFVPEPGPGLVAHVAIVVARDDQRLVACMDSYITSTIEIRAGSTDDLAIAVGKYSRRLVRSIGDPGYNGVGAAPPDGIIRDPDE